VLFGHISTLSDVQAAFIDHFETDPARQGTGTRLMKALVAELKTRSINQLWSGYVSSEAIGLRLKLFGENILQFYDGFAEDPTFLPMTTDQYLATLKRLEEYEDRDDEMFSPPSVYADLSQVDTTDWQRPLSSTGKYS
jgi:hypothetical protein